MTNSASKPKTIYIYIIGVVAVFAILLVAGMYASSHRGGLSPSPADWGVFGDYAGGVLNPLFSFLALLALLITITIQNEQLYYSRKELELTQIELTKTADAAGIKGVRVL